ncbi:MAG: disulfide bond formation protein B, partial [Betaproteobacteria bacterium]|nr:disulfide bond formation protein B [Betaproteobacteria bacterium]
MTCVPPRRLCHALGFLIATGLLAFALYLQHAQGEDPCPLCIFQRVVMIALGVLFLLAALLGLGRIGTRVFAWLIGLTGATGALIAARHVWIQHMPPDQVPACGPGLNYILQA